MTHLQRVLRALTTNLEKSHPGWTSVQYLGFQIGGGRPEAFPDKMSTVRNEVLSQTKKDLQWFIGPARYCRRFIPRFATRAAPLTDMLRGKTKRSIKLS